MRFLILFAELDIPGLREGDRLNLAADLQAFLGWARLSANLTSEEVLETQRRLREELLKVAIANAFNVEIRRFEDQPFESLQLEQSLLKDLSLAVTPGEGLRVHGPLRPAVLFTFYDALSHIDSRRLRRCIREGCGRLFLAEHKNSFFCSAKCANRDAWVRFHAGNKQEEAPAGKRRQRRKAWSNVGSTRGKGD
jgi:hypothetical protein